MQLAISSVQGKLACNCISWCVSLLSECMKNSSNLFINCRFTVFDSLSKVTPAILASECMFGCSSMNCIIMEPPIIPISGGISG